MYETVRGMWVWNCRSTLKGISFVCESYVSAHTKQESATRHLLQIRVNFCLTVFYHFVSNVVTITAKNRQVGYGIRELLLLQNLVEISGILVCREIPDQLI